MVFDYMVKYNGKYYKRGEEVPADEKSVGTAPTKVVEPKAKVEDKVADINPEITREQIASMPYMALKSLAKKNGINVPNTIKADELKAKLYEKFNV